MIDERGSPPVIARQDISSVTVSLEVASRQSLFISLAADGSIARQGTGRPDNREYDMFVGRTGQDLFETLMANVSDELLEHAGRYVLPNREGPPCRLTIAFSGEAGEAGFDFFYGAESEGPPQPIYSLVAEAVRLTQPWFEAQARLRRGQL